MIASEVKRKKRVTELTQRYHAASWRAKRLRKVLIGLAEGRGLPCGGN